MARAKQRADLTGRILHWVNEAEVPVTIESKQHNTRPDTRSPNSHAGGQGQRRTRPMKHLGKGCDDMHDIIVPKGKKGKV